ncbi:LPO_1073/Vpar_1526 family protein [Faecalibacterium sp. An122]|uniref:LPO_1073/Vpar_1526 family protein n=1 Tax=Faecalibacterium sp. An122 TaxID=1965551 RepID=UPI00117B700E|nr:LPO_1073/Vpar_1526 family protein [Faecalibacterium sp. An122]
MMDGTANSNVEVNQRTAFGSTATQIGQQNNYYGISPDQACQMVVDLFMQNFPKLQDIARETAEIRATELCNEAIQKISSHGIQDFSSFADPDVQYILYEAQKNYARFGTSEMLENLSELIAKRVEHNDDLVLKVAIDKAIEIAPLLSQAQLNYLSLLFIYTRTQTNTIKTIQDLQVQFNYYISLLGKADFNSISYLNMLGCLQLGLHDIIDHLSKTYGFPKNEVEKNCPELIKNLSGDYMPSHIGVILAITNLEVQNGPKLNPQIWVR